VKFGTDVTASAPSFLLLTFHMSRSKFKVKTGSKVPRDGDTTASNEEGRGVMEFGLKGMSQVCRGRHGEVGIVEFGLKGAITSKIKHAIKLKTSPARLAQLLQPSRRTVCHHWLQAKTKC